MLPLAARAQSSCIYTASESDGEKLEHQRPARMALLREVKVLVVSPLATRRVSAELFPPLDLFAETAFT